MATNQPFNALKVLEAAIRHGNYRLAAEELEVTPAAVSHHIHALEEHYGVILFERDGRGVAPTANARAVLPVLQEGFARIEESIDMIEKGDRADNELVVCAAPLFTSKWLIPRLAMFHDSFPDIRIRLCASIEYVDTADMPLPLLIDVRNWRNHDVEIRFGSGAYADCEVHRLLDVDAVPLCSPALLSSGVPLKSPRDLTRHTLLHDSTRYERRPGWNDWFAWAGLPDIDADDLPSKHFNRGQMAIDAAINGQGLVLSLSQLTIADEMAGRLVRPFERVMPVDSAYHLVHPPELDASSSTIVFRDWLLANSR